MKKINITFSIFGFLLLFASCSRDYPLHKKGSDLRFPLSVGNWWQYERVWTFEGIPWVEDTLYSNVHWKIVDRDNLLSKYDTYVLQGIESSEEWQNTEGFDWYTENWEGEDGLFHIAYSGGGPLPPKSLYPYRIRFMDEEFNSPSEVFDYVCGKPERYIKQGALIVIDTFVLDTLIVIDTFIIDIDTTIRVPPRKVLVYPLWVGKEWVAFDDVWLQKRKVVGVETITTPAGDFLCYKIQVYADMWDEDAVWYDWFSGEGLVKRYFWWRGAATDPDGNIIGTFESTDIRLLQDYSVRY